MYHKQFWTGKMWIRLPSHVIVLEELIRDVSMKSSICPLIHESILQSSEFFIRSYLYH